MSLTTKDTQGCFHGQLLKQTHKASTVGCEMTFNLFLPKAAVEGKKVPLLIWLSGLTCNEDNCAQKGFLQNGGREHSIAVLYPDTSPRNVNIPGEDDSWDFGSGAGHYVDATAEPFSKNYKMYSYITEELPKLIADNYSDKIDMSRVSLSGHSMGGHGALMIFLRNPGKYKSVSAVAPMANPTQCPWGEKAFKGYLGEKNWKEDGAKYDSTELLKGWKSGKLDILIDTGSDDSFLKQGQLLNDNFVEAAKSIGQPDAVKLRYHPGYGHSYFTVATFADDHMAHHAKYLNAYENPSKRQKL